MHWIAAFFVGMAFVALPIGVAVWIKVRRESSWATSPEERAEVNSQNLFSVLAALMLTFPLQVLGGLVAVLILQLLKRG